MLAEEGGCNIDEEGGVGAAGEAPDDVGSGAIVPTGHFVDDADCFIGLGYVGAEVVEALGGVCC